MRRENKRKPYVLNEDDSHSHRHPNPTLIPKLSRAHIYIHNTENENFIFKVYKWALFIICILKNLKMASHNAFEINLT